MRRKFTLGTITYSLVELIYFGEAVKKTEPKTPAEARWKFLNKDLLNAFSRQPFDPKKSFVRSNVMEIIGNLYQKPISHFTSRYNLGFDKKCERVIDIYYLTEREIQRVGRRSIKGCGQKTIQYLNTILDAEGLPDVGAVTR